MTTDNSKIKKYFDCFLESHAKVHCPNRPKESSIFLPTIDNVLLSRFLSTLSAEEQYFIKFLNKAAFNFIDLKSLKRCEDLEIGRTPFMRNCSYYIVVDGEFKIEYVNTFYNKSFFDSLTSKVIIKAKQISLAFVSLSTNEFFQLFSCKIRGLYCWNLTLTSSFVTFNEIMKMAPKIVRIELYESNILINISWLDDLHKYCKPGKFQSLKIKLNNFDFNAESLANFITTKSSKNVQIELDIFLSTPYFQIAQQRLSNEFLQYFDATNNSNNKTSCLRIQLAEERQNFSKTINAVKFFTFYTKA